MRRFLLTLLVFVVAAMALAPAIALLGLDQVPGDFVINQGNLRMTVPVTYSLCASFGMGLLYYVLTR